MSFTRAKCCFAEQIGWSSQDATGIVRAANRWVQATAGLQADIPFQFRHCSGSAEDSASANWQQYMLQYRSDYTYRRLEPAATSDGRIRRDVATTVASDTHSASDNINTAASPSSSYKQQHTCQSESRGRTTGHRSAPASFVHTTHAQRIQQQQLMRVDTSPAAQGQRRRDSDHTHSGVSVRTVSLQLTPPATHHGPAAVLTDCHPGAAPLSCSAKSPLRCPAIRIHLNSAVPGSTHVVNVPTACTAAVQPSSSATTNSVLPPVVNEPGQSGTSLHQLTTMTAACDSQSTFAGRTMRHVPSNGYSIDDRTMSVTHRIQ